jgi:hypothetical protein
MLCIRESQRPRANAQVLANAARQGKAHSPVWRERRPALAARNSAISAISEIRELTIGGLSFFLKLLKTSGTTVTQARRFSVSKRNGLVLRDRGEPPRVSAQSMPEQGVVKLKTNPKGDS